MVKQPETRDRFIISAEVEPGRVGDLLAQLTKMGFDKIGHELIIDVADYKRNGAVKKDKPARQFVAEWIEEHPSFAIKDLCSAFEAAGYSPNNAYKIVKDLVEAGSLRKLDQSNYQRADIKALAPPPTIAVPVKAGKPKGHKRPHSAANVSKRYDVSNRDLMLQDVGKRKTITSTEMRACLKEHGRPEKSASPMLTKMTQEGLFEATKTPGTYHVTEKGQKEARRVGDRLRKATKPAEAAEESHG